MNPTESSALFALALDVAVRDIDTQAVQGYALFLDERSERIMFVAADEPIVVAASTMVARVCAK